jgi:gamma-glutamylcyclotransferase (GGCT)/AIG2-like uncharacterized protein YtfP
MLRLAFHLSRFKQARLVAYNVAMHIFTYGTLMFPEVWQAVAGSTFKSVVGTLRGYAAFRVRDAVFPGILRTNDDSVVHGVLYLNVDDAAIVRLDQFEDDFYERQTVNVDCLDGPLRTANTYVVPAKNRQILTDELWTREAFISSGGLEQFISKFAGFRRIGGDEK